MLQSDRPSPYTVDLFYVIYKPGQKWGWGGESLHPSCLILKLEPPFSRHAAVVNCSLPGTGGAAGWIPKPWDHVACPFPTSQGTAVILHTACQALPGSFLLAHPGSAA